MLVIFLTSPTLSGGIPASAVTISAITGKPRTMRNPLALDYFRTYFPSKATVQVLPPSSEDSQT